MKRHRSGPRWLCAIRPPWLWPWLLFCAGVLAFVAAQANGAPVLGNLAQPAVDNAVPVSLNSWQASSFRLAEGAGVWRLRSVTLRLACRVPNSAFTVSVQAEDSLRPASAVPLAAFTTPAIDGSSVREVTFTAKDSPEPKLQPGRTYWLTVGVTAPDDSASPATGLYHWSYADHAAPDFPPAAGWEFGPATASAGTSGSGWQPENTTPFTFGIDAVPDDPTMTLSRWRALHPGGPENTAAFLAADPDGDGLNGLLAFAFDNDRTSLPIPVLDATGRPGLEFTRWIRADEITVRVQTSTELLSWSTPGPADLDTTLSPAGPFRERVRVFLPQPAARQFMRVLVSLP